MSLIASIAARPASHSSRPAMLSSQISATWTVSTSPSMMPLTNVSLDDVQAVDATDADDHGDPASKSNVNLATEVSASALTMRTFKPK